MAVSILALAACGDSNPTKEPICGDGIVAGDEACDDGNTDNDDQCNNSCQVVGCGDGLVAGDEACDDGNTIDGDGCDSNCTETACGNGIMTDGEACDDGDTTNGDGCDDNCRPTGCGNGAVGGIEECDDGNAVDGDGCDLNCMRSACGNGITAGDEQCDDTNNVSLDGCTSTCQIETAEHEPNEDGSPETGGGQSGNDFAIANADINGAFTTSVTLTGSLTPAGDEDVFKFTNTGARAVRFKLDVWNLAAGFGIGTACGTSIDTMMNVRNAAGDVLVKNDDRNGAADRCSSLAYPLLAGETVYVQVSHFGDSQAIASYALDAKFEAVVCGDGSVGPGEQCDDHNTATGDGCSDMCQIEGAVTEIEPNEDGSVATHGDSAGGNDFAIANADLNGAYTGSTTIIASLMPAGDEDVFKISNTSTMTMNVALDVWDLSLGVGFSCGTGGIDTVLDIRRADGTILATNNDRSPSSDRCSRLVYPLAPGQTVYAQVFDFGDDNLAPSYALEIGFTPVVCGDSSVGVGEQCDDGNTMNGDGCDSMCQIEVICGDGILEPTEQCDDGNTVSGDGCSSLCKYEGGVTEVEPNEDGTPDPNGHQTNGNDFAIANADTNGAFTTNTTIVASLMPTGDEDVFKISNTGTAPINVALDTWDLGLGVGISCGTSGTDTVLNVRDASGTILRSNNDRMISSDHCAGLRYPLLPGETIYAQVLDWVDNSQVLSYALQIQFLPSVCGNDVFEAGEQCDDGNTTSADGCSSTCQLEGTTSEVEPNEDGSPAPGGNALSGNDFSITNANNNAPITGNATIVASLMPVGDEDVFKITNTGATGVRVALDTWNLSLGIGVSCGTSGIDTALNVRNAGGTILASNSNRASSDACAGGLSYPLLPGESIYAQVVDFQDNGVVAGYLLQVRFTPEICGDGAVGPGEQCDDGGTTPGDGCSALCQIESICGDGVVQPGEQCDDHNTIAGDGCSATCQLEGAVAETEPNDDGTPSTGGSGTVGNDFNAATAGGPYASSTVITGSLSPIGDEDVYAITNPGSTPAIVNLDIWNLGYQYGIGVPCGASIDTGMNIRDSSGALLASNDDRSSSLDRCSTLTYTLAPSTTVYAHVVEFGDNGVIPTYALVVTMTPTVCGDGNVGPGEQCDDGNTTSGDGCSSTCQAIVEIEPNDTTAAAMASTLHVSSDATIAGAIGAAGDKDVFAVTVAAPTVIRFETFTSVRDCAAGTTLDLRLFGSAGAPIVADTEGQGIRSCGAITFPLAAGSYYIQVEEHFNDAAVPAYLLEIAFQDDVGTETEPNETDATASVNLLGENESYVFGDHMLNADLDVYAVTVPAGMRIRAEVIEGDLATERCESNDIDSNLTLYGQNGVELVNDTDNGRGLCSLLDGTGGAPVHPIAHNGTQATQTFYLKVGSASMSTSGRFVYRLQVTVRR